MKMSLHELDAEISEIESRIAVERLALDDAISGCTNSLRNTVSSPKTLLALAGIGFAMGKLMFGRKLEPVATAAPKAGMLGLLTGVAGTALSLMRPGIGVGTIARWAASKAFSPKQPKRAAPAPASRPRTTRSATSS
ncbi:MAG TPA: hypothetical protein VM164_06040 [Burkholderiales bacterium]|nr:hypothetical protein [Burkholderiales bacterium]